MNFIINRLQKKQTQITEYIQFSLSRALEKQKKNSFSLLFQENKVVLQKKKKKEIQFNEC